MSALEHRPVALPPVKKITATATPAPLVMLTGILGLRRDHPHPCQLLDNGTAVWHLNYGIVVTCHHEGAGHARWHIDTETA